MKIIRAVMLGIWILISTPVSSYAMPIMERAIIHDIIHDIVRGVIMKIIRIIMLCVGILVFTPAKSYAMFPTFDGMAIVQAVMQFVETVKQSKAITATTDTISKTNAAFGSSKSSIAKLAGNSDQKKKEKDSFLKRIEKQTDDKKRKYKDKMQKLDDSKEEKPDRKSYEENLYKSPSAEVSAEVAAAVEKESGNNDLTDMPSSSQSIQKIEEKTVAPATSGRKKFDTHSYLFTETIAFGAQTENEEDFYPDGSNEGTFMFSDRLSEFCKIQGKDASTPSIMADCMMEVMKCLNASDQETRNDCNGIYKVIIQETNTARLAEAMKIKNDAINYENNTLDQLSNQIGNSSTYRDDTASATVAYVEKIKVLNDNNKMLASEIAATALENAKTYDLISIDAGN